MEDGTWKSINTRRCGPKISHLIFDDDLLLFGQAYLKQMQVVKHILDTFYGMSGQRINFDKSTIFFSKNTPASCRHHILQMIGMKETMSLGLNLGTPLTRRSPKAKENHHLIDKVKQR